VLDIRSRGGEPSGKANWISAFSLLQALFRHAQLLQLLQFFISDDPERVSTLQDRRTSELDPKHDISAVLDRIFILPETHSAMRCVD